MIEPHAFVCPTCGQPAGAQPFCASCGRNLAAVDRLPTRVEWQAEHDPVPAPPGLDVPASVPTDSRYGGDDAAPEQRAAWGYRVGAFLVDAGTAAAIGLGLGLILQAATDDADMAETVGGLAIFAGWLMVTAVAMGITRGQTLGKWVAGTRVIHQDGRSTGFFFGLLRDTICRFTYIIPLVGLIDALMPLGEQRRSIRDRIVDSDVIKDPAYPKRVLPLVLAALAATGAWFGLAAVSNSSESNEQRTTYVRYCVQDGRGDEAFCECAYEEYMERFDDSRSRALDGDDALFEYIDRVTDQADRACS